MSKNAHLIEARYIGPTNTTGSRVRLFSHRFPRDSVTVPHHTMLNYCSEAEQTLHDLGYTIECRGEMRHGYFFVVSEFLPLRDAAAKLRASRKRGEG